VSKSGEGEAEFPVELEIIEWKNPTERVVYLCNEAGFPLSQSDVRLQAPGLNFSAYLKSPYISKLSREGLLGLAEMNPVLNEVMGKVAENTWIFGEEFSLSVDDKSLTEVLKKHLASLGVSGVVDEPVKRIDGKTGIVDLMLTRSVPCHRENELEHLIIELKRPTVDIGPKELAQVESYAFAVAEDERFNGLETRWVFWVISNSMDDHAKRRARQANMPPGLIHQSDDKRITIWAKTWSEVLQTNRYRLKLFQQKLEFNADRDVSLEFLRETYANVLRAGEEAPTVDATQTEEQLAS
jgi:hypothetical protein